MTSHPVASTPTAPQPDPRSASGPGLLSASGPGPGPGRRPGRRGWALVLALAVVLALLVAAVLVVRSQRSPTPTAASTAALVSVRSGCAGWAASAATPGPSAAWCGEMVAWMSAELSGQAGRQTGGRQTGGSMMGGTTASGMMGGPDQLRASCRQWAADRPDQLERQSGGSPAFTCDDMVTWMAGHAVGGWGTWMMPGR